jgi:1-acyl-sn-glycerol-3-phosphate acyltransferase
MAGVDPTALYSERQMRAFHFMFGRYFEKHMRALRLAQWGRPAVDASRPLVVFANHPSWWDGVAFMLLSVALFPGRRMFIPMDATALAKYPFMRRLGVFGVDQTSQRGAALFLRTAERVLAEPSHMLWLNAPGRFQDVRERPVAIAPGLMRLPELAPGAQFLPLALDYPFWSERKAEMLAGFGAPLAGEALRAMEREARAAQLGAALQATLERLAADAIARDAARFDTLRQGREGMGGIYQGWRQLGAALRGRPFDPRHGA